MTVNYEVRNTLPLDSMVFDNPAYDNSIIGISLDGRVIYAYELMVAELMSDNDWSETDCMDWIDYNSTQGISSCENKLPIIVSYYV